MLQFVLNNGNPWGKQLPDCMVRVPCIALNMSYLECCKVYEIPCKDGEGIYREEKLNAKKFVDCFSDYIDDYNFDDFMARREKILPNIKEWAEEHKNTGRYMVCLRHSKEMDFLPTYHASCLDTDKMTLLDKFDCSNMEVMGYAHFRNDKILSNKDPRSRFQHILKKKLKNFS